MSKYRRWKPEEDLLLAKLYNKKTNKELARIFDREESKITRRAMRLGIKKDKKVADKHVSEALKKKFKNGELTNKGHNNPRWNGGTIITSNGYVLEWTSDSGYIPQHRLVMEKKLKRKLTNKEVVHHIDHNPLNNKISNLALCKNESEHKTKYHLKECLENIKKTPTHIKYYDGKNISE